MVDELKVKPVDRLLQVQADMRALTAKLRSDVGGIDVEKVNQKVRERLAAVWHERTE